MKFRTLFACLFTWLFISTNIVAEQALDKAAIQEILGGSKPTSIKPSKIPGLYEVVLNAQVLYITGDGRYVIQGEMIDAKHNVNLTEPARRTAVNTTLSKVGEDEMIVFSPKTKKHSMTVFTDIDCGYCRKLHGEMDKYLEKGIEVRYMMYPRAGKKSEAYKKAEAVWCADDKHDALTKSKNGKAIPMKTCDNPIDAHMALAKDLGLRGTPLLVLDDGSIQPGYIPPDAVAKYYEKAALESKR